MERVTIGGDRPDAGPVAPVKSDRPEGVPEKFWNKETKSVNTDALLKSYSELEKRAAASEPVAPAPTPAVEPAAGGDSLTISTADAVKANLFTAEEASAWGKEFTAGGLKAETYKTLESRGLNRDIVDSWLAGQQALMQNQISTAHALAGGKDKYEQMATWAKANLSPAERDAYNAAVAQSGAGRDNAIRGLTARWAQAEGSPSERHVGATGAMQADPGFRSTAELIVAIKDPRYKKDPAYRADVERRARALS